MDSRHSLQRPRDQGLPGSRHGRWVPRDPVRQQKTPAMLVLLIALAVLLLGAYLIFSPFLAPIVLALLVAITAYPLFCLILRKVGGTRRGLASGMTCGVLVLAVFVPLVWVGWAIVGEMPDKEAVMEVWAQRHDFEKKDFYKNNPWVQEAWARILGWCERGPWVGAQDGLDPAQANPARASEEPVWAKLGDAFAWIRASIFPIVSGTFQVFLKFCLMLLVLFFFLKDGTPLLASIRRQIPIEPAQADRVVQTFVEVSRSIIRGTLGTAFAQGLCATLAYAIIGVPAVLWGFLTLICAMIPPLGTTIVTVPMMGYQLLLGHYWQAAFLLVVSIGIGLLDNFLKPYLMRDGLRVHSLWLFLAILGGINAFGPMGIIYGPMVLVFLGTFVALFVREEAKKSVKPQVPAPQTQGV